jgi:hypothetical protein
MSVCVNVPVDGAVQYIYAVITARNGKLVFQFLINTYKTLMI